MKKKFDQKLEKLKPKTFKFSCDPNTDKTQFEAQTLPLIVASGRKNEQKQ